MSYFRFFQSIKYPFEKEDGSIEYINMIDITKNTRFIKDALDQITLYDEYSIEDGDTPEIIAHKIYGNVNLHWIIMLANLKFNLWNDFPLSQQELYEMAIEKYGESNLDSPKIVNGMPLYIDRNGVAVDLTGGFTDGYLKQLSNYDYEVMLNDKKRIIKLIHPSYVTQIISEFEQRIKNG